MERTCLVILSGGQDSATCLALAASLYEGVYTLSFDYSQRHRVELEWAEHLSKLSGAKHHEVIRVPSINQLGNSALTSNHAADIGGVHPSNNDLPASFVPGRNIIFLMLASVYAYKLGIKDIYIGVSQTDFSGYPDCRHTTIKATETAVTLGLDYDVNIFTPLIDRTKAETVQWMDGLGHLDWYKWTHTCYEGKRPPCGECPACKLRAKGFEEAGISDPLIGE